MGTSFERTSFRLKDLLSAIQDKNTVVDIRLPNGVEIIYDLIAEYKDYFVIDIGIKNDCYNQDTNEYGIGLSIVISKDIEIIYTPAFLSK